MRTGILFVGGGSIGHIAPAIAIMQAIEMMKPGVRCHFVCLPSQMETEYLQKYHCAYSTINSPRLSFSFPWKFLQAYTQASRLLTEVEPAVVFSKGGHLSVPVCLAARRKGIPIVLHESDAMSGYANRIVGRWANAICTGFPLHNPSHKYMYTGNPIRREVTEGRREEALRITGLKGNRPVLLVMGGSQGAQALNEAVAEHCKELLTVCDVIHITGRGKQGALLQDPRYVQRDFVYDTLPHFYALADLALSRAGANALSELAANGIHTIVVPLRSVGHDHQQKNAEAALKSGCVLLQQNDLKKSLVQTVKTCLKSRKSPPTASEAHTGARSAEASVQIAKKLCEFLD
ncbi:hypothetical protein COU76_04975 [Candidatus Peregrinibacteria bacterium CG10_big_fil_rev_8_21_14_0_10_49_10]|nr:MAG: hypothetical protein COU76_04975 [Candidatus Peregrinibacteria bacterium CG10_big_fil_rev_8_21_14_0_10_49_10]